MCRTLGRSRDRFALLLRPIAERWRTRGCALVRNQHANHEMAGAVAVTKTLISPEHVACSVRAAATDLRGWATAPSSPKVVRPSVETTIVTRSCERMRCVAGVAQHATAPTTHVQQQTPCLKVRSVAERHCGNLPHDLILPLYKIAKYSEGRREIVLPVRAQYGYKPPAARRSLVAPGNVGRDRP